MKYAYVCFLTFFVTMVSGGKECTTDSECDEGQCCQIQNGPQILRKRNLANILMPRFVEDGICEPYRKEGDNCEIWDSANGVCGCQKGTQCKSTHRQKRFYKTSNLIGRRKRTTTTRSMQNGPLNRRAIASHSYRSASDKFICVKT